MIMAAPAAFKSLIQSEPGWETLEAELQHDNPYVQIYRLRVRTPSRPEGVSWTLAHRKSATVIAPMTADGRLLLIRQERVPIHATLWEFPAGQIDDPNAPDAILDTARRELREESGYELPAGGEMIPLGVYYSSPGFTDEHCHLFLARGVIPSAGGMKLDENEAIHEARPFTLEEVRRMIAGNEIRDANTLAAFARMTALGLI
jgi:ADP-ribose pyrophosphatase